MLDIYYYSLTGNIRRFLAKTGLEHESIEGAVPDAPFVLVTNTLGFGEVPEPVAEFLDKYGVLLAGVAASGNRNWGDNYGKSARIISEKYQVPIVHTFEMAGTPKDIEIFNERMRSLGEIYRTK